MNYGFDKHIQVPLNINDKFAAMEVGESFVLLTGEASFNAARHKLAVLNKGSGKKYVTRTIPEGLRIWRKQ